jgi:type VI secretion system secreted protein VgrG
MARTFELTTPLGEDLLFRSMHGREELARLSAFDLSTVSTRADIGPGDLLGKNVTVKVELGDDNGYRYFNGYVTRFAQGGMVGRYYEYRMTVGPWLWFLTRTTDCRIFQEKTVPAILKEVFADHAVAVFEDGLTGTYKKREYCVQYRETDFNFVSRLMEEEGIYYYLDHQDGRHVLKLVDSYSGHKALEGMATIAYYPPHNQTHSDEKYIHAWSSMQSIQPGAVALDDYDFMRPKADLMVKAKLVEPHERADYEIFDYPGEYLQTDDGEHYVRARMDELHAEFDRAEAESNVREITVGWLFSLTNAPRRDQEREYLIVGAQYHLRDNAYETAAGEDASYHCQFTVLQSRQQFRPARITAEPKVSGPQTAMVVGPAGEEIWTDKYGRVKVQFHWDRYGKKDENSSCWIRVSHPWAGTGWGSVSIPRIGQEVIVDFLEGDPDQPIITGRVYNADSMPTYGLPAGGVVSGLKTNTHKGKGYNEMSMDDTAGKEKITVHGQYDMDTTIEHNDTQTIKNDRKITVNGTHTETIKMDTVITISDGKLVHKVLKGTAEYYALKAVTETFDATQDTNVKQNITIKSLEGEILIEAAKKITLHTGSSKIEMDKNGLIKITGKNIFVLGDTDAKVDAPKVEVTAALEVKIGCGGQNSIYDKTKTAHSGAAINASAVGMHEITGALVKIN